MKRYFDALKAALASLLCVLSSGVMAQDSVRVAYFSEWATPNLAARADGVYDAELGIPVYWQAFSNGAAMTQAMLAGEIDIAYSQGSEAFVAAVNAGAPISVVAVAVAYPTAEDCIARAAPDDPDAVAQWLTGKSVALPLNTLAEFHYRKTLDVLGVDLGSVTVVDLDSAEAATALVEGTVVMACGFGENALERMRHVGASVLDVAQKRAAHLARIDLVTVSDVFKQRSPDAVRAFLRVTQLANAAQHRGETDVAQVAAQASLSVTSAEQQLGRAVFPTSVEQRGPLFSADGALVELLAFTGAVLATDKHGALGDYNAVIDRDFLP